MGYCPECGKRVSQTANFCQECGYKLKLKESQIQPKANGLDWLKDFRVLYEETVQLILEMEGLNKGIEIPSMSAPSRKKPGGDMEGLERLQGSFANIEESLKRLPKPKRSDLHEINRDLQNVCRDYGVACKTFRMWAKRPTVFIEVGTILTIEKADKTMSKVKGSLALLSNFDNFDFNKCETKYTTENIRKIYSTNGQSKLDRIDVDSSSPDSQWLTKFESIRGQSGSILDKVRVQSFGTEEELLEALNEAIEKLPILLQTMKETPLPLKKEHQKYKKDVLAGIELFIKGCQENIEWFKTRQERSLTECSANISMAYSKFNKANMWLAKAHE